MFSIYEESNGLLLDLIKKEKRKEKEKTFQKKIRWE
jgi:hypothetical protein